METRENERREAGLLVVVAVCQRSPKIELGVKTSDRESLVEGSEIVSKLRLVEPRLLELRCVEWRFAELRCVELRFAELIVEARKVETSDEE